VGAPRWGGHLGEVPGALAKSGLEGGVGNFEVRLSVPPRPWITLRFPDRKKSPLLRTVWPSFGRGCWNGAPFKVKHR